MKLTKAKPKKPPPKPKPKTPEQALAELSARVDSLERRVYELEGWP